MNVFDLRGPEFLKFYFILLCCSVVLALILRWGTARAGRRPVAPGSAARSVRCGVSGGWAADGGECGAGRAGACGMPGNRSEPGGGAGDRVAGWESIGDGTCSV